MQLGKLGVETISPGCGVRASLLLFFQFLFQEFSKITIIQPCQEGRVLVRL